MVDLVKNSVTDGEICNWVRHNVKKSPADKAALLQRMLDYPKKDDAAMQDRLNLRKQQSGLSHRDDIQCFVDYIDADEKRS
jgi:hypothetical protein